jgi:hypothetical protein
MSVLLDMVSSSAKHDGKQASALREAMQEIALAALYRAGFFNHAAFYGGTCLRIFYNLPRFSEDLDFSLLQHDAHFSFKPYFESLKMEFQALGVEVEMSEKQKTSDTAIASAFLKKTASTFDIALFGKLPNNADKSIKIKLEVDTEPPLGFKTEQKLLLQPFSCYVNTFCLPDLFAGKAHALMYRRWQNRVKGRDWFDFEWYVRQGHAMSLAHFNARSIQSLHSAGGFATGSEFKLALLDKINQTSFDNAKSDVLPFVQNTQQLAIWSSAYFADLVEKMKINE